MDAGVGEIVDIKEFAPWRAGAPDHDFPGARKFRLVETADQGGDDMAVFRVVVIPGGRINLLASH
jgi:hypothetical protein